MNEENGKSAETGGFRIPSDAGSPDEAKKERAYVLQLNITASCNLQCQYCYVKKDAAENMSLETAQAAILGAHTESAERGLRLLVTFMGGEPLLAFARIREICEWTWARWPGEPIHFSSPTNGTMLTEEQKRWFSCHADLFTLALSYDGDVLQNRNRGESKAMIDRAFFLDTWPNQPWKMTISENNVDCLAENILGLQWKGIRFSTRVAFGQPKWQEESMHRFGRQLMYLARYYADCPELPVSDLLDIDFASVLMPRLPMRRSCELGMDYVTVDADGARYPCALLSPLTLTEEQLHVSTGADFQNDESFFVDACKSCLLNHTCPRCYAIAFLRTGSFSAKDENICSAFRWQTRAACSYQIKRLHREKKMSETDRIVLAAVRKILGQKDLLRIS